MSTASSRTKTKASNHLTHGLTSRSWAEGWREEVEQLTRDIVGDGPRTADILETAAALARSIILVEATRIEKRSVFGATEPPRRSRQETDVFNEDGAINGPNVIATDLFNGFDVVSRLTLKARDLRRLDELERKATSRRNELLRHLDYLVLEERRRQR